MVHTCASSLIVLLSASSTAFTMLSRSGLFVCSMSPSGYFLGSNRFGLWKTALICTSRGPCIFCSLSSAFILFS